LHQRTHGYFGHNSYLNWALTAWKWFEQSGMINAAHLVNDGLNKSCVNNDGTTWTYNQGVILGGLVALYQITGERVYLERAEAIALAALHTLVNARGILIEPCEDADCGGDGPQFKGIFMRNLFILYEADHKAIFRQFILHNAAAIWQHNKNAANQFGLHWDGPFDHADAARQASALDALNAAIPFSSVL
jgi:predicted alpha-1,6-mannanase (GH76 family)